MAQDSRAEYFRERRAKFKTFSVAIEREKMERLEEKLGDMKVTKASWLNEKIDEELGK